MKLLRLVPAVLLLAAAAAPLPGAAPELVLDINTSTSINDESIVGILQAVGGKILFWANELGTGYEPWVTDGTPAGTRLLADFCPGPCFSYVLPFGRLQGLVLLRIEPQTGGLLLGRSDGTPEGTFLLTGPDGDLRLQPFYDRPQPATAAAGGRLFFKGCSAAGGCEPWVTDGTPAGTYPLGDLSPGPSSSFISSFATFRGRAYFYAWGRVGEEQTRGLWTSDGTPAGTVPVVDLTLNQPILEATADHLFLLSHSWDTATYLAELWATDGTPAGTRRLLAGLGVNQYQQWLRASGDRIYFMAGDGIHGQEFWTSDGTPAGSGRLTDLPSRRAFQEFWGLWIERLGTRTVFFAGLNRRMLPWASDGTPETTRLLCPSCDTSFGPQLLKVGRRVVFSSYDASHGLELWTSDGTPAGTRPLPEPCPGSCSSLWSASAGSLLDAVFYFVREPGGRHALWRTDGTPAGTRRFVRLPVGVRFGRPHFAATPERRIVFTAVDARGEESWVSDGTPGGTRQLADLGRNAPSSSPRDLTPVGNALFFNACDGTAVHIWGTAGSAATTGSFPTPHDLSCFDASYYPEQRRLHAAAGKLFFLRGEQLWVVDGLGKAPRQLTSGSGVGRSLAAFGNRLWFAQRSPNNRWSLWRTDGTAAGTRRMADLPRSESEAPGGLTALGSELYFTFYSEGARQVWSTDGTAAGTRRRTTFPEGSGSSGDPRFLRALGHVFFVGEWERLWRLDPNGMTLVHEEGGLYIDRLDGLTELGGALFFLANTADEERALWRTDGTADGTAVVRVFPGARGQSDQMKELVAFGGRLFFPGDDGVSGRELWTSEGTAEGTRLLVDLAPGPAGAAPAELTVARDRLYFAAWDPDHGAEAWTSDGTAAGTRRIEDLAPGLLSSSPADFTVASKQLYFTADDAAVGRELWSLPLP